MNLGRWSFYNRLDDGDVNWQRQLVNGHSLSGSGTVELKAVELELEG